ncbi:hypothetical protein L7F22_008388 [Adiantum nelumboides]|nr:hypothetical protein [Adiantum nelumboides]
MINAHPTTSILLIQHNTPPSALSLVSTWASFDPHPPLPIQQQHTHLAEMTGHRHFDFLHGASKPAGSVLQQVDYKAEEKKHKQRQHAADAGALAAGAFALHEKHAAKKHPEQRHAHKVREHVAAAIAIGAGTLAVHEKHERKHAKKQQHASHNTNYNKH